MNYLTIKSMKHRRRSKILTWIFSVFTILMFLFSFTAFAGNNCKNFEKHLKQHGSFENLMPPMGQHEGHGHENLPFVSPIENHEEHNHDHSKPHYSPDEIFNNFQNKTDICEWVDLHGRSREKWHFDLKEGKPLSLFRKCDNKEEKYSKENKHPGCKGIINAYTKQNNKKGARANGLIKNYNNCMNYGTPYPGEADPSLEDISEELISQGSIMINSDELFTESQSVSLLLNNENAEEMQFSEDSENWTEWEDYKDIKDFLITDNSEGIKTVYVKYKTGELISEPENDKIMLLPKYGAEYKIVSKPKEVKIGQTFELLLSIKNTGFLTWDSNNPENPVQLKTNEENNNYAILNKTVSYGETIEIPILLRAPMQAGPHNFEISLEEYGIGTFSEFGVKAVTFELNVSDKNSFERKILNNIKGLEIGIGGYASLENEAIPEVVTVCKNPEYLYELSADGTMFNVKYALPFGRSIHNVQDIWIDTVDNTAFYKVNYNEYISDTSDLYLYRDSAVENELCPIEQEEFSSRACDEIYPDTGTTSNEICLDIAKATSNKWVNGYADGYFKPEQSITKVELAKILIGVTEKPVLSHPDYSVFTDIDANSDVWYKDYAYSAFIYKLMTTDSSGNFEPDKQMSFLEAVETTIKAFDLDINACNFSDLNTNQYIGAAIFYGLIEKEKLPSNPASSTISREYMTHILVNAYAQKSLLSENPPVCQSTSGQILPPQEHVKEICGSLEPVILSSGEDLKKDLGLILNGTKIEIQSANNEIAKIKIISSGQIGYLNMGELADSCALATPAMPLEEAEGNEIVVASLMGIYVHQAPNAISAYVDINGDNVFNNQDILPYNSVVEALKVKGNWILIKFKQTDGREKQGWIFNGFVNMGETVPVEKIGKKEMGTISWAYGMTVDLRRSVDFDKNSIIWELYEGARVQIIEKDPNLPFYFVKIETESKPLSAETIALDYARPYEGISTINPVGISGWIHEDFVKIDGKEYNANYSYPFEYNADKAVNDLVNQIFMEELMGKVHTGIDYDLEEGSDLLAVSDGIVEIAHIESEKEGIGNYILIKQEDGKYSRYGHLKDIKVIKGQKVNKGEKIGISGGNGEFDAGSGKAHLHFEILKEGNSSGKFIPLNPAKYISGYNIDDGDACMSTVLVDLAVRDAKLINSICNEATGMTNEEIENSREMILDLLNEGLDTYNMNVVPILNLNLDPCRFGKDIIDENGETIFGINDVVFNDISNKNDFPYYCDSISYAKAKKWVKGYDNGSFGPYNSLTRAEALKIIMTAKGITDPQANQSDYFSDTESHWGEDYINYAHEQGWINGYENGDFGPNNEFTYSQMAKITIEVFGLISDTDKAKMSNLSDYVTYSDKLGLPEIEKDNINKAVERGFAVNYIKKAYDKADHCEWEKNDFNKLMCYIEILDGEFKNEEVVGALFTKVYEPEGMWDYAAPQTTEYKNKTYGNYYTRLFKTINKFHKCDEEKGCWGTTASRIPLENGRTTINVGHVFAGLTIKYFPKTDLYFKGGSLVIGTKYLDADARTYIGDFGAVLADIIEFKNFTSWSEENVTKKIKDSIFKGLIKKGDFISDIDSYRIVDLINSNNTNLEIGDILKIYYLFDENYYSSRFSTFAKNELGEMNVFKDDTKDINGKIYDYTTVYNIKRRKKIENEITSFALVIKAGETPGCLWKVPGEICSLKDRNISDIKAFEKMAITVTKKLYEITECFLVKENFNYECEYLDVEIQ